MDERGEMEGEVIVRATLHGYGTDEAEASVESALVCAQTLAFDIREHMQETKPEFNELVQCNFIVNGRIVRTLWF
jgi:hypothetical protein